MTLPNLISFSGYAESGKDAAADIMVVRARFVKTYIAKPLEQALEKIDPWIVDRKKGTIERFSDLYTHMGDTAIKDFEEIRRLLKMLETEVGQKNRTNIWTDLVFEEVQNLMNLGKNVALSGVQTPEELALVREYDGVCVWIDRAVPSRHNTGTVSAKDCDVIVENDGTLKDLYVNIVTGVEQYNSNKLNKETDHVG